MIKITLDMMLFLFFAKLQEFLLKISFLMLISHSNSFVSFYSFVYLQVTNPAIDPLREGLVMSLEVNVGKRGNILEVGPENASQVC